MKAQPNITLENLNANVLQIVSDLVMEAVTKEDEHEQWLAEFNEVILAIREHLTAEQLYVLENAPWAIADPFGYDMFLMGVRIGRDPLSVLTLPECGNQR